MTQRYGMQEMDDPESGEEEEDQDEEGEEEDQQVDREESQSAAGDDEIEEMNEELSDYDDDELAAQLMAKPLANPTGYGGPAGRRPPPLRIMWAALRNVRLLFSVSKTGDGKPDSAEAAERTVEATRQLAVAAIDVPPPPCTSLPLTCLLAGPSPAFY